jgi:ankyrin repeat protein
MEEAINKNDIDLITYLLDQGYDPNFKNVEGSPLLHLSEDIEIIRLLLEKGADPNITDIYGFTLDDYTSNNEIKELLKKPRNAVIIPITKALRYNETLKLKQKRAKTYRVKKAI